MTIPVSFAIKEAGKYLKIKEFFNQIDKGSLSNSDLEQFCMTHKKLSESLDDIIESHDQELQLLIEYIY